jgi:cytosine/adenosine deaminase-related metal-dependent hydrolase
MSSGTPQIFSGKALVGEDLHLTPVDIIVERGLITAIEDTRKAPDLWICPALFNAHTHLGDTIAMDCATGTDLVALVTPPHGLKHQLLAQASHAELVTGMRRSIRLMADRGTAGCADFREGGETGVAALREATEGQSFRSVIFGRDGGEKNAHGLGVSSARDIPDLERVVYGAKTLGRMVAFHAGEKDPLDIDSALSFDPDLIIHATHATDSQLKQCAENNIPIAVCPRSNWTLSVSRSAAHPPVGRMLELGCRVFLGTDNVMFVQPDLLSEMAFLHTVYRINPADVLRMAVMGSSLLGNPFFIVKGARANFFILDPRTSNLSCSRNPIAGIVNRAFSTGICKNVFNS